MGIKELWPILQPFSERKPLYELEGKIVAIDLAGWVCESLCVVDYVIQPRFYLRNLFFRTCYLLLSGVTPVFVLEYGVICKRNELQFRGARPKNLATQIQSTQKNSQVLKKPDKGRSRFNYVLKQCEELIASMGLQCVQGPGEAEQFCAFLNEDKMVDGVISQDSDCFAYGAVRVYRNFSVSSQGTAAAQGGAVDVYDIENVQKSMDFGRNKMIVLALLCGCDYCPGVTGVGKDAATKFLNQYSDKDILTRIKTWRSIENKYTSLELKVDDKRYCANCGHFGSAQKHGKSGCSECRMSRGCDASTWKEKRLAIKCELQIRKKAMADQDFPSQKIIDEYMNRPVALPKLDLTWKQPNVVKFLKFMSHLLQWEEIYCFQKFLPLLTRWQLFHYGSGDESGLIHGNVSPDYIKKKRTPKGIASYEIIWKDENKCFDGLIPEEQMRAFEEQNSSLEILWSTVEPVDLVEKAYPKLVANYLESKSAKTKKPSKVTKENGKKATKTTQKKANKLNDENQENLDAEKLKKPRKKLQRKDEGKVEKIDKYFKKVKNIPKMSTPKMERKATPLRSKLTTESPKIKTCSSPLSLTQMSFDFNVSSDDIHDLSDIIRGIVASSPTIKNLCGKKLHFESVSKPLKLSDDIDHEEQNETLDEFDIIVAGTKPTCNETNAPTSLSATKSRADRKRLSSKKIDDSSPSKTPILIKKFFKRNLIEQNSSTPKLSPRVSPQKPSASPIQNEVNVSYFFGDITAENDVFEKLTDFRNMEDEVLTSEEDIVCRGDELHDAVDSPPIELNDTFGLDNYIPVGANLRKRLAS
ncbi:Flap endonuclease GEN [Pseudolycoriella hygida]|uniref:Flap endonuclease GEN n=1 Tax=Pseudolycoriella hygida TaxID=35572 RepID=A0A9Q0N620_9DIPT|nr:Flap endonuclease GEN [Pseudolycoriella hygida]